MVKYLVKYNFIRFLVIVLVAISICVALWIPSSAAPAQTCPGGGQHEYTITVIKAPTGTDAGMEKYTCTKCGHTYEAVVPRTGHSYSQWQTVLAPTCIDEGQMERSCTTCDKIDTKVISPTGNHHFGSWITVQVVSQTQEGIEERICTVCGSKETKIIDMITSPTVSPDTEKKKSTPKPDSTQLTKEAISTPASAITTPTAITTDGSKEFSIGFNALDGILAITNAAAAGIYATLIRRDQYIINWDKHRKALGVGKQ